MSTTRSELEQRVLIFAPVGKDGAIMEAALRQHDIPCIAHRDVAAFCADIEWGVAALVLTEESLRHGDEITRTIAQQPPWSDIPVILFIQPDSDSRTIDRAIEMLGNVTLHERPVRIMSLISATRSALRARARQFQVRAYLESNEDANRRKDEFLATLAHELRNPLAPIRNAIQLLRMTQDQPPVLEMMERQLNLMVRLVDDLMEISRITSGKIELRTAPSRLQTVIESALETSRPMIQTARHELTVSVPSQPMVVFADSARLAQVFSNLLNNAAKFTEPGGKISIDAALDDGHVAVKISDNGIGIQTENLPNIFEMFRQGPARPGRLKSGLGIGLALARKLIEMHGGSLTVHSDGIGTGSQFTVRLPLAATQEVGVDSKAPHEVHKLPRDTRILVVDDNCDAAVTLGQLLELLGAKVSIVHDGQSALDTIASFHPRVIFLDLGLPGMDGYEVAHRLHKQVKKGEIKLVAVTGWGQHRDRTRTAEAGFAHHLVKPVSPSTIEEVVMSLA